MGDKLEFLDLEEFIPEIWRLYKKGKTYAEIAYELFKPLYLPSLIRKRLDKIRKVKNQPDEDSIFSCMDKKYLKFDVLDAKIWELHNQGLDATQIVYRLFNPLSLDNWIGTQIRKIKKNPNKYKS